MNIKQRARDFIGKKLAACITEAQQKALQLERAKVRNDLISKAAKCGGDLRLLGSIFITGIESAEIGDNVHIGDNAYIRAEGGLTIGDNAHISRNLVLYTINHNYCGCRLPYDETMIRKHVSIGKNVWIGMNVCITSGTTIGDGAIIGMGATVSGTVPPLTIVGNQKLRELGKRDREHYEHLDSMRCYAGMQGLPLDAAK